MSREDLYRIRRSVSSVKQSHLAILAASDEVIFVLGTPTDSEDWRYVPVLSLEQKRFALWIVFNANQAHSLAGTAEQNVAGEELVPRCLEACLTIMRSDARESLSPQRVVNDTVAVDSADSKLWLCRMPRDAVDYLLLLFGLYRVD